MLFVLPHKIDESLNRQFAQTNYENRFLYPFSYGFVSYSIFGLTCSGQPGWKCSREKYSGKECIHVYNEAFTGPNSLLYHGVEYIPNALYIAGDAFFLSDQWRDGDVCIECKVYENVPLLYDIFKDQLVLQSWNKIYRILLDKQNVRWFTIGKHRFVCIDRNDSTEQGIPPSGYYEELIRGPVILLAKRVKSLRAPASAG